MEPVVIELPTLGRVLSIVYDALLIFMNNTAFCQGCIGCETCRYEYVCGDDFVPYTEADLASFCARYKCSADIYEVRRRAIPPQANDGAVNLLHKLTMNHPTLHTVEDVCVWSMARGDKLPVKRP